SAASRVPMCETPSLLFAIQPRKLGIVRPVLDLRGWMLSGNMLARDIAERQRRAERDAGAGIVAAHDARHIVADRIEARDRLSGRVQCAGAGVGPDAGVSAEITDHHLDRTERAVRDRRDAGVGAVQRIALVAVIGARAL